MDELAGKVAIVTGASRGIGEAAARQFAQAGVSVVLAARSEGEIKRIADEIVTSGGKAMACACDVSDIANVAHLINASVEKFGRLDIVVNNAGVIEPIASLAEADPAAWRRCVDINYMGVYHSLRAALPVMEKQGNGVIVNISSGAARGELEGWSSYCSTKAAVHMLTKCAHLEYGDKGIRVVGLAPGTVATDMQVKIKSSGVNPISQLEVSDHIRPEWAGRAIVWICTDAAGDLAGVDFNLREDASRRRVGLID